MSSKNDITGAELVTKAATRAYHEGWERVFGKKKSEEKEEDQCASVTRASEPRSAGNSDASGPSQTA